MPQKNVVSAAMLGALLAAGLIMLGHQLSNAALDFKQLERTVTVKGLSEKAVAADVAIWPLNYQIASNELENLYQTIQSNNESIVSFLEKHGITRKEITFNPPVVNDAFAQSYNNNAKFRYSGQGSLTVYSEQIDKVREAMANTIELGKQGIVLAAEGYRDQTVFMFNGLNDIKPTMVEEATRNAREVAEKFASDSDSKLGKIKTASQGQFSISDRDATTPYIKKVRVVSTIQYYLSD